MNIFDYILSFIAGNNSLQFYQAITPILLLLIFYFAWLVNSVLEKISSKIDSFNNCNDELSKEIKDELKCIQKEIIEISTKTDIITTKAINKYNEDDDSEEDESESDFEIEKEENLNKLLSKDEDTDQIMISNEDFETIKKYLQEKQNKKSGIKTLKRDSRLRKL